MNRNLLISLGLFLIILSPALLFFPYAWQHTIDFPYYDDFGDATGLVAQWQKAEGWWHKISLLFEQNYDHRVLLLKVTVIGYYLLTAHLNFRFLILLGDLSLLGIWLQYYILAPNPVRHGWILFAIAALLFQVQHYESTILWMTCALQHAPCVFLTTFAIQQAVQKRPLWAMALALLAMLSSSNGLITPILVLAVLFVQLPSTLKWAVPVFVAATVWHLSTFTVHSGGDPLATLLSDQPTRLLSAFAFAGGFIRPFASSIWLHQLVGLLCLVPVLMGLYRLIYQRKPLTILQWVSLGGLIFVWFTAFLVTQLRNPKTDYGFLDMARYYIYFIFFPVFSIGYVWYADEQKPLLRWSRPLVAICSGLFCLFSYYAYYGDMIAYRKEISLNQPNYAWSQLIYYPSVFNEPDVVARFDAVYRQGVITGQQPIAGQLARYRLPDIITKLNLTTRQYADRIELEDTTLSTLNSQPADGVYILLANKQKQPRYVFVASHNYLRAYRTFAQHFYRPVAPGFSAKFYTQKLQSGTYLMFVVQIEAGQLKTLYRVNDVTF